MRFMVLVPGSPESEAGEMPSTELLGEMTKYNEELVKSGVMLAGEGLQGVDDIRLGDRFLTLRDTNDLHLAARSFLAGQLRGLSEVERGRTVLLPTARRAGIERHDRAADRSAAARRDRMADAADIRRRGQHGHAHGRAARLA